MTRLLARVLGLLSPREQWLFAGVAIAGAVAGLMQVVGIGSVVPFVSLLLDPAMLAQHAWLARLQAGLGFAETGDFLTLIGAATLLLLVLGNALAALSAWLMARFLWNTQVRLSTRLLAYYLAQPYATFLARNSAEFTRNVLFESTAVISGILAPLAAILAASANVLLLVALLFWLSPWVTVMTVAVLGGGYALVYWPVRSVLDDVGRVRLHANQARLKAVAEAFGSIKLVKVSGRERAFVESYVAPARVVANAAMRAQTLAKVPRFAIEALAFGLLIGTLLVLLQTGADMRRVLPVAVAFALGGLRLAPALQTIYASFGTLRLDAPILETLTVDFATQVSVAPERRAEPLPLAHAIRLEGVAYSYHGAAGPALDGVTLEIAHPSFVAIVGRSGAGKTTLVDIILGLLEPQRGKVLIDDVPLLAGNRRAWQAGIGYVPQEVVLADDTVATNIAFGIEPARADLDAVRRAARTAGIHDFIESLPGGYGTQVGERGVRLSGGQRQRIGLARALYQDPALLVLDEATNALDHETEAAVHQALLRTSQAKTVVVIAHRFTTIRDADRIFVLDEGRLAGSGRYDELMRSNAAFRRIAAEGVSAPGSFPTLATGGSG